MRCRKARCGATPTSIFTSRRTDEKIATPIVEIKNLNSFRAVEKALIYEVDRQYKKWREDGLTIDDAPKSTRGWNDFDEVTKPQREKESVADYRYFPEPDLVPVEVDAAWLDRIRASIGELPAARRQRFESQYGLSAYDANVLVEQGQDVADYFDAVARVNRGIQAGEQLDPAGRAQDDQGKEADPGRFSGSAG